jgi:hypothetical protein
MIDFSNPEQTDVASVTVNILPRVVFGSSYCLLGSYAPNEKNHLPYNLNIENAGIIMFLVSLV